MTDTYQRIALDINVRSCDPCILDDGREACELSYCDSIAADSAEQRERALGLEVLRDNATTMTVVS